ncbi:Peptidoglycan/LPS O-acetylase OafA/YrhL, contains acyltransferase and SGNH-hydrolase domains [Pseudarthrobacter equi]|uniref:Peptidoglycan/LPS O-acetylase OafA/YrhL, contains acyltransferase and SGNH-hydrolase domains n=1 Tax=Pseudarthrobacter equi TaxID=728066 RepID=A0A1H2ALA8_9MICC|nr:acyltransferase family protein [Pseudarthrobacter equi]SDT46741.1 Peptidoglycan/LPS O-acetylase OafA/YrhL, contains acyltransferase and SGNH-hydrolase domains [Pseudarthrobacter equi]
MTGSDKVQPAAGAKTRAASFRPEVQGLRALAVLMVVAYHVWLGRVSGGVDIFLLISAFLLTLSFVRKAETGRPFGLLGHWLHLFKRLLPAAVVVILGVLAGTWLILPQGRWPQILDQAWASLLYRQNWLLADTAVDYYAQDHAGASPLQHFWSLSIQGQVFILWPLIFAAAAGILAALRRLPACAGLTYRGLLGIGFGAVFAVSLAYSVEQTAGNQAYAYFDTRARLWEFALGSLLALALPYLKPGKALRVVLGWAGLVGMVSCGLLLTVDRSFPGFVALWPTLSAAAIIVAGQTGSRYGVDRVLSSRPAVALGDNSYALYLWHWPVLVLALAATGVEAPNLMQGLGIVGASVLLAVLTTRFVEKPLRDWHWPKLRAWRTAVVIAACGAILAGPVSVWQTFLTAEETATAAQPRELTPGAAALTPGIEADPAPAARIIPGPSALDNDWAGIQTPCVGSNSTDDPILEGCRQEIPEGGGTKRIVVLGDSHSQQYLGALAPIAAAKGWELVTLLMPACRFGAESDTRTAECNAYNRASADYVLEHRPDAVFTVASLTHEEAPFETEVPGYLDGIRPFADAGIEILGIRDNPRFTFNMPECVQRNGADAPECNPPLAESLVEPSPLENYRGKVDGLHLMDMSDFICARGVCPAVVGNVYVYKDDNHLSRTYAESMIPMFEQRLLAATGWT